MIAGVQQVFENVHVEYLEHGRVPSENNPCIHLQAMKQAKE